MRLFVVGFLALFVVVALAGLNLWPLTSWQLFSRVRGPTQAGWQAVMVDSGGAEVPVPFASLPRGYRGSLHLLERFPSFSPAEREAVCEAWREALGRGSPSGVEVRVYRIRSTVSLGVSPPTTAKQRELRYTC